MSAWLKATKERDPDTVLRLMTDDVKFLVPGHPPFGKVEFERGRAARQRTTRPAHTLTIFRKVNGRWLLARDANLLSPPAKPL